MNLPNAWQNKPAPQPQGNRPSENRTAVFQTAFLLADRLQNPFEFRRQTEYIHALPANLHGTQQWINSANPPNSTTSVTTSAAPYTKKPFNLKKKATKSSNSTSATPPRSASKHPTKSWWTLSATCRPRKATAIPKAFTPPARPSSTTIKPKACATSR